MFDTQDHSVRDPSFGLVSAELAVSVVATSRRKTGLWTDDKTILEMARWDEAGISSAYVRVRRK